MGFHRDRRLGTRLPMKLLVGARYGRSSHILYTENIAFEGLFLVTDSPAALHHLLHLKIDLPPYSESIRLRGVVIRVVTQNHASQSAGVAPGMGVHLYGFGKETRKNWFRFVERTQAELMDSYRALTPPPTPFVDNENDDESSNHEEEIELTRTPSGLLTPLPKNGQTPLPNENSTPTPKKFSYNFKKFDPSNHIAPPPPLYRFTPKNTGEMARFRTDILEPRGVVLCEVPTVSRDSLAVVSIVHPSTTAELHFPGTISEWSKSTSTAVFYFHDFSDRTLKDYDVFVATGTPPTISKEFREEKVMYEDAHEIQQDVTDDCPGIISVREFLPISSS